MPVDSDRRIYPLTRILASQVDETGWPAPRNHHHVFFQGLSGTLVDKEGNVDAKKLNTYLSLLDVFRQRPDISCLCIEVNDLHCEQLTRKLEELLSLNDRSWYIEWRWTYDIFKFDSTRLTRGLSVLGNVTEIFFNSRRLLNSDIMRCLPHFKKLKRLSTSSPRFFCSQEQVEMLFQAPFSPQLDVVRLSPKDSKAFSVSLLSTETAKRIHALSLNIYFSRYCDAYMLVTEVEKLPCLRTLAICLGGILNTGDNEQYMGLLREHFRWLQSTHCPVTNLFFWAIDDLHIPMILGSLPNIPKLRTLRLRFYKRVNVDLDCIFSALLKAPNIQSLTMLGYYHQQDINKIFEFQRHNRPRMVWLPTRSDQHLEDGTGPEKINYTSWVYQTLQDFERSKKETDTFPLSAWSIVLEKLGIAFDCPSTDVHAVGVEARFFVIQELMEGVHRLLVNHNEFNKV